MARAPERSRVYFFVEAKWAIEDVRNRELKVSRLLDLNDPFELFALEQSDHSSRKRFKKWADAVNEGKGVLCFTGDWHDPLMWSHYGDGHRGTCLGFDVRRELLKCINYEPERLKACMPVSGGLPAELEDRLLTTKFERWAYENEVRIIVPLPDARKAGQLFFRKFGDDLRLAELIAGPRCCLGWRSQINDAIKDYQVRPTLLKARLAFRTFKVVTQKWGSPEKGFLEDSRWRPCACGPDAHKSAS